MLEGACALGMSSMTVDTNVEQSALVEAAGAIVEVVADRSLA